MAYCAKCGAYIPDGQIECLACGYDPAAEKKAAEARQAAAAANASQRRTRTTQSGNEELRKRLEEQRKRTQEQNRRWAEEEKSRREEQAVREEARRQQQEEDRRWAQEEYERRQAERSVSDGTAGASEGNKALAALSYLSVLFVLPYIFAPQDRFATFHAKQGIKLFIFGILADVLSGFIGLGWIAVVARLYLIYKGMSNALNGITEPLPYIGTLGEK